MVCDRLVQHCTPVSLDFALHAWHDCASGITNKTIQDGNHQLTHFFKQTLAAAALAAMALPGLAVAQDTAQQAPSETVKATHGAWEVVCKTANPDQCRLNQVGETADGKKALIVNIVKLIEAKTDDGKNIPAAIRITTPLGTILRQGLKVQIDSGNVQNAMFEVCVPSGCIVSDAISDEFLAQLKAGSTATMSFSVLQQGKLDVNISLKGFTKAFKAL
jgi:invasion protein IalB